MFFECFMGFQGVGGEMFLEFINLWAYDADLLIESVKKTVCFDRRTAVK